MKVFWSWQSDTPGKTGRHFVRDALNAAIEQLKEASEIAEPIERETRSAMHLDQDRQGISGSPDLARVILEKIEQSAVFVADVTVVGIVPDKGAAASAKKLINPNVAIELGYALHALSDRSLLMVMNEHYGSRADLPFDLQSKAGPILFRLPPDADKQTIAAAARQLTARFAEALEPFIGQHMEGIRQRTPFPEASATDNRAIYFRPNEVLANAGYPGEQQFQFPYERMAYIRLFPTYQTNRVGLAKLAPIFEARKPCPMTMVIGGIPGRNRFGPIIFDPQGPNTIEGLTQGFETGELWGVNGIIFAQQAFRDFRRGYQEVPVWVIPTISFEKLYVRVLTNYVKVMSELQLAPPYTLEMGLVGLQDSYFTVPGLHQRGEFKGPILQDLFQRRYSLGGTADHDLRNILRTFFEEFYDLAAFARGDVFDDKIISAHDLPSR